MSTINHYANYGNLFKSMNTAASALEAQSQRVFIISQNLANVGAQPTEGGKPYQRKVVYFKQRYDAAKGIKKIEVQTKDDSKTPFQKAYDPSSAQANNEGYVETSNVNPFIEYADMREANLSIEGNIKTMERCLAMFQDIIGIIKV